MCTTKELGSSINRKPTYDFPKLFNTKFCFICHRLAAIPMGSLGRQSTTSHFGKLEVNVGGRLWGCTDLNLDTTFVFDFYTHDRPILHRLGTVLSQTNGQTDIQLARNNSPCERFRLKDTIYRCQVWQSRGQKYLTDEYLPYTSLPLPN